MSAAKRPKWSCPLPTPLEFTPRWNGCLRIVAVTARALHPGQGRRGTPGKCNSRRIVSTNGGRWRYCVRGCTHDAHTPAPHAGPECVGMVKPSPHAQERRNVTEAAVWVGAVIVVVVLAACSGPGARRACAGARVPGKWSGPTTHCSWKWGNRHPGVCAPLPHTQRPRVHRRGAWDGGRGVVAAKRVWWPNSCVVAWPNKRLRQSAFLNVCLEPQSQEAFACCG